MPLRSWARVGLAEDFPIKKLIAATITRETSQSKATTFAVLEVFVSEFSGFMKVV